MNNTTVSNLSQPPVIVEQGPNWLIQFYLEPPGWVNPALKLLAVIVFTIVVYRLYQSDWKIGLSTQREMQLIVATIVGVTMATTAMMSWFEQPYVIDVVVGFSVGYGAVEVLYRWPQLVPWPRGLDTNRQRVMAIWFALGILVMIYPALVGTEGMGLGSGRLYLLGLSFGLVFYNGILDSDVDIEDIGTATS